jgi:predicted metal-dependent peptidase
MATVVVYEKLGANEEKSIEDNLIRSRIQMLMTFPFFGILALHLQMEQDYTCPTAATDGNKFFYNPHFIKKLSEEERNWIVVHEVLHPALKHLWRRGDREPVKWNYACDYAIHSIMMQFINNVSYQAKDKLKMPPGCLYDPKYDDKSAEEIYDLLPKSFKQQPQCGNGQSQGQSGKSKGQGQGQGQGQDGNGDGDGQTPLDDHSKWGQGETQENGQAKAADWEGKLVSAAKAAESKMAGTVPGFLKRLLGKITKPQKDWRTLLHEFVEEEVSDYSFNPPDRRYQDGDFFLPDFNDIIEVIKKMLFFMDTSGSIGDREMNVSYSEVAGAITQFNDRLSGWLGFFDHAIYGPWPFENVTDLLQIRPEGGGGTSFHIIFDKVKEMREKGDEIAGVIILTDGYADWPPESIAEGIPVLWLINNEDVTPPWGLHTRIKV